MFEGENIIVLDLETLNSADEVENGWGNKLGLGLSIGGFYDYESGMVQWFDRQTLANTMSLLVLRQPIMVSFNGISFDFALMRAILRDASDEYKTLCDDFKLLASRSYDILREVWKADPENKFEPGLNSLDAICKACELGEKTGDGKQAPKDWQAGKIATVVNYCQNDIMLTKSLFEFIHECGHVMRASGPLKIRAITDLGIYVP